MAGNHVAKGAVTTVSGRSARLSALIDSASVLVARFRGHRRLSDSERQRIAADVAADPDVDRALRAYLDAHPEFPSKDSGSRGLRGQ